MTVSRWHLGRNTAADQARARRRRLPEYRAAERSITAQVAAGTASCWRCGGPLLPGKDRYGRRLWHVGHDDHDVYLIRGGEHPACNLKAGASKGARATNARRKAERVVAQGRVTRPAL